MPDQPSSIPFFNHLDIRIFDGKRHRYGLAWNWPRIRDCFSRLYYLHSGHGYIKGDDFLLELRPGYLYLIPEMTVADYWAETEMELCWLHFYLEFFPGVSFFNFFSPVMALEAPPDCGGIFDELLHNLSGATPKIMVRKYALLLNLLSEFLPDDNHTVQPPEKELARFRPVINEMTENPQKPFDLKRTARQLNLQPTYFSNRFKEVFGISPLQFQTRQRMKRAYRLLQTTDLTLKQIAAECGYEDEFFFARTVKKQFSISPGKLRQRIIHENCRPHRDL